MTNQKALTLAELVVVVLIFGILTSIAVPVYRKAIIRVDIREAVSNLRLIYAAQKTYVMKFGGNYYVQSDEATINNVLHLDLERNRWDYSTGDGSAYLGRALYLKGPPNIDFRVNDSGSSPGEPFCFQNCNY